MITLQLKDGRQATLDDQMEWQAEDSSLAVLLNTLYSPLKSREGISPAHGHPGSRQASQAASDLGGRVEILIEEGDPDVVY